MLDLVCVLDAIQGVGLVSVETEDEIVVELSRALVDALDHERELAEPHGLLRGDANWYGSNRLF